VLDDLKEYLRRQTQERARLLQALGREQRQRLLELLIEDFFAGQRRTLMKWATLTGQSAQVDTGYIAQHMASVCLGVPGQGFKGKGVDLVDHTEVKSAAILGGVDRPRWNHNMGTLASDLKREAKGLDPAWASYLVTAPNVFYVLFDRVVGEADDDEDRRAALRVRAWCVDAKQDLAWRDLLERFVNGRTGDQYNLQLHPPVGYDDDIVVNTLGNLDFSDVKVLEARFRMPEATSGSVEIEWVKELPDSIRPVPGRTTPDEWKRGARPSRLEEASGRRADESVDLDELFPGLDLHAQLETADPVAPVVDELEPEPYSEEE
jgi:hypothetical protein